MGSSTRTPTRAEREILRVLAAAHAVMDKRGYPPASRATAPIDGRPAA